VPYANLEDPQTLNLYGYVRNNPLSKADLDGHIFGLDDAIEGTTLVAIGATLTVSAYLAQPENQKSIAAALNTAVNKIGSALDNVFHSEAKAPPPVIVVDGSKHPEAAKHIDDAQAAGKPCEVTIDRAGAKGRRAEALKGQPVVPGQHRNEYPPAVTKEGGAGASVRPISPSDNTGAGADMGNQMRPHPDGTTVTIKPINVPN
jgi:hypothetical protein